MIKKIVIISSCQLMQFTKTVLQTNRQARREGEGQGGQMPRGPATFRGPVGPGRAHSQHCQLYFGSVTALYMRARDRSAQKPGFSLGGPANRSYSIGMANK